MKTEKQRIGAWGEEIAARFLLKKGYTILFRNFQTKMGELDIIAWHEKPLFGTTLCFIEVKTRGSQIESGARATSRYEKMRAMQRTAMYFCLTHKIDTEQTPIQFEYINVHGQPTRAHAKVTHVVIQV